MNQFNYDYYISCSDGNVYTKDKIFTLFDELRESDFDTWKSGFDKWFENNEFYPIVKNEPGYYSLPTLEEVLNDFNLPCFITYRGVGLVSLLDMDEECRKFVSTIYVERIEFLNGAEVVLFY